MRLTAYYRICLRGNGKPRPPWFTARRALTSFLESCAGIQDIEIVYVADGGVPADLADLISGEVVVVSAGSAPRSFRGLLDIAAQRARPGELVWFAEDDYVYRAEAMTSVLAAAIAVPQADYVGVYTPDNRAWHRAHASQPGRRGATGQFEVDGTTWVRSYDSTSTFGVRSEVLRADHRTLRLCSRAGGPWDNTCITAVQGLAPYAWRHLYGDLFLRPSRASAGRVLTRPVVRAAANLLAREHRALRRRTWIAPAVALATHAEVDHLATGTDWAGVCLPQSEPIGGHRAAALVR